VLASAVTSLFFRALNLRTHLWHLRDLQGDFAFIRYLRKGKHATETSSWSSIFPTGNSHGLDVFAPVDEQIRWLRAKAPRVLMTYPSNLEQLLHAVRDGRVRLPSLQQVRTFGEALPDTLRVLCDSVLGIPLVDQYSSMELGLIAIQCPRFPHYHVQAENVYVEILNDAGQPCAPGEIGRVVVTDLHNFASPLLRYELGDLAEPGEPCPCGRGLPVINRVLGRVRGMMAMRDGTRRWPRGYSGLAGVAPIRQFQIVQKTLEDLLLRLVVLGPLSVVEEDDLCSRVRAIFGDYFRVQIDYCDRIERDPTGKYRDFICEV
jgi:phenylacetate-CoA ligase